MRRRTSGVKKEQPIMIIPMIDIVLLLLVFLMVVLPLKTENMIT